MSLLKALIADFIWAILLTLIGAMLAKLLGSSTDYWTIAQNAFWWIYGVLLIIDFIYMFLKGE